MTKDNNAAWFVYIVECADKKLYTGITNNLTRRIQEHNGGYGCVFTSVRAPVCLRYSQEFPKKSDALRREIEIKGFTRKKKLVLLMSTVHTP